MRYKIVHELPGRLRICLLIPKGLIMDKSEIEQNLQYIPFITDISYNYRTRSLLVKYKVKLAIRDELLEAIEKFPFSILHRKKSITDNLEKKKRAAILAGVSLIVSHLLPPLVRFALVLNGGLPILKKGIRSLSNRRINIDVLDSSALSVAIGRGDYGTAGILSFLLKVGDYLEEWTRDRSRKMLTTVFQNDDEYAWVIKEKREERIQVTDIKEGDVVIVRSGSHIPVDGVVINGEAMVNQSSITGEPLPVWKRNGITVFAGTAAEEGTLAIRTVDAGNKTRIAKIIKVIEESEALKADVQSYAERLSDRLVPYSFLLSGITYTLSGNSLKATSVLLVDYSCALRLSIPLTMMSSMLKAARRGVLIKGGKFIEKMSKADVFVVDKTGTLTEAAPEVIDVIPFRGYNKNYVLRHAACVEEHFPHPIATAVVKKAQDENVIHKEEHRVVTLQWLDVLLYPAISGFLRDQA